MPWICKDPASQRLFELAGRVAPVPTTVLITGESGTGKDYFARLIHELGPRRDTPFLKIECKSLPPPLLESELFGHERGAFPGAAERKHGRFELDSKSTIVLDEVAALTPDVQARLLRVMEERVFERLGSKEHLRVEARIIALTNADLAAAVKQGRFRGRSVLPAGFGQDLDASLAGTPRGHFDAGGTSSAWFLARSTGNPRCV